MPVYVLDADRVTMKLKSAKPKVKEGEDYYLESGLMVFTSAYHRKRGYCCQHHCRHCPYGFGHEGTKKKNH
jgi:hypothetical protein